MAIRYKQPWILSAISIFVGIVFTLLPQTNELETDLGNQWLFDLRGPRTPPGDVVIVNMDLDSASQLHLADINTETWRANWPRSCHAQLIRKLANAGARAIIFDVFFESGKKPQEDKELREAMYLARNIVLIEKIDITPKSLGPGVESLEQDSLNQPLSEFAQVAAAVAPFPLPLSTSKVNQYWLFRRDLANEYIPTLPVVAMQVYTRDIYNSLIRDGLPNHLKDKIAVKEHILASRLSQTFQNTPELRQQLQERLDKTPRYSAEQKHLAIAVLDMYAGPPDRALNFYGPPQTIATIPYHRVVNRCKASNLETAINFHNKAVFVGFSATFQGLKNDDTYPTVFQRASDGLKLSGVEIAATAFANLLEHRHLSLLSIWQQLILVTTWGILLGVLFAHLPASILAPVAMLLAVSYLGSAYYGFAYEGLRLPLITPGLLQPIITLLLALLLHYRITRQQYQNVREGIRRYIPDWVVTDLLQNERKIPVESEECYGVCLYTDAARFTGRSERLTPLKLHAQLNQYYRHLFRPIAKYGGFVSDVVGDAMLAVWRTRESEELNQLKALACMAALEILEQTKHLQFGPEGTPLATRIGMHSGIFSLGHLGAEGHYEFRAVGDVVNSSQRIEGVNKLLGTYLLVSEDVVTGTTGFVTRSVGRFRLRGKSMPMELHELLCHTSRVTEEIELLCEQFSQAMQLFKAQRWQEAADVFQSIITLSGADGPSIYYLRLCERYQHKPPSDDWDGVMTLDGTDI